MLVHQIGEPVKTAPEWVGPVIGRHMHGSPASPHMNRIFLALGPGLAGTGRAAAYKNRASPTPSVFLHRRYFIGKHYYTVNYHSHKNASLICRRIISICVILSSEFLTEATESPTWLMSVSLDVPE